MSDILDDAKHIINVQNIKEMTNQLKDFMPEIAKVTKITYDEYIKQGFDEIQAFQMAKDYTLLLIFQK